MTIMYVLRTKYTLPIDAYIIGSFVRDTEGGNGRHDALWQTIQAQGKSLTDLQPNFWTPKLEKGPDLLANYLEQLHKTHPSLHVLLAGWRRQYIMSRLERAHIPYTYFERPSQEVINELYQTLDLYVVSARQEGGPQALIETGLLGVPVISRDVGIAQQVLPGTAINDSLDKAVPATPNVEAWKLPGGFEGYRELLQSL